MGKPVTWAYQVTIQPWDKDWRVGLYRVQEGTDTRFLWLETNIRRQTERLQVDGILQELYAAVVALMEISV